MPRRNLIQRIAGILLIVSPLVAHWGVGLFSRDVPEGASGITESALLAFGFLIGIWLLAASFVYPRPRR